MATSSQFQRWSGSSSSTASTTANSWMGDVLQRLDEINAHEACSEEESSIGKGKKKQEVTDEQLARSLFAEETLKSLSEFNDEYIPFADQSEDIISNFRSVQLQQAVDDLDIALQFLPNIGHPSDIKNSVIEELTNTQADSPAPNIALHVSDDSNTIHRYHLGLLEFYRTLSSAGAFGHEEIPTSDTECGICGERITGHYAALSCGHQYDINCLMQMFSTNVNDEIRFPPRCCGQDIPMRHVESELSQETAELYKAKIEEYKTPYRLYCSNRACAKFLGPRADRASSRACGACGTQTCSACAEAAHDSNVRCKIDKGLRKALVLGQSNGWQRCPGCRSLVERNMGCYHMSCRCGHQFCYICAAQWKTCNCTGGTSRLLRIIGAHKFRVRGNYLLKGEFGANGDGTLIRLCKKSWNGVARVVPSVRN